MKSSVTAFTWKLLPLVLFVMLFCNGCWDKKEFNQLAIAQTIAMDYEEEQYKLTVQLVMPAASDEEISGDSMWLISGEGDSVAEALEQISRSAPRELYLAHLDIVLLGEGLLRHDISQGLEYFIKEDVLRRRTNLLAVEGAAGELLQGIVFGGPGCLEIDIHAVIVNTVFPDMAVGAHKEAGHYDAACLLRGKTEQGVTQQNVRAEGKMGAMILQRAEGQIGHGTRGKPFLKFLRSQIDIKNRIGFAHGRTSCQ